MNTISERTVEIPWALMQLPQTGVVLDIGSCEALYLPIINQRGRTLHCLDPRNCIGELPPDVVFHNQSLIGNDLPRAFYDAVLVISTIEHIGLPCYGQKPFLDGDQLALAEIWGLLKPGCPLIATMPAGQDKTVSWYRQYSPETLKRLFQHWRAEFTYWGFDGVHYVPIEEHEVTQYDYRDSPGIGAGAGAFAGIVAYTG